MDKNMIFKTDAKNDTLTFADEIWDDPEAKTNPPWKVIIADDEEAVHKITRMVLADLSFENKRLEFYSAYSGKQVCQLMRQHPDTALVLLDVVMETVTAGLDAVNYIRNDLNNRFVRFILRTGQPGYAPEHEIITTYDINDYRLKTELTDQTLHTAVITALRTFRDLQILESNRQQLQEALGKAEAALKTREQFLANMHHELKTPLNGIVGASEILMKTQLDEHQQNYVNIIQKSGWELLEIINTILRFSELEYGSILLSEIPFNIHDHINDLINSIRIQAKWKDLEVRCLIDNDVPDILYGDPDRLKQVLMNLMTNAIRHTEAGGIVLHVCVMDNGQCTDGDDFTVDLLFHVKDTGIGVSVNKSEQIFEPFELGENVRTKQFGGVGLGLAIAKRIIEKMNGNIWIDKTRKNGATFSFSARFRKEG